MGDRWRDIEAGHRAGCRAIFVDYGYAEQRPDGPFVGVRSLREAAQWILRTTRPGHFIGDADAMPDVASFRVKIFADGADRASILELADNPLIQGIHHQSHADAQSGHHRLRGRSEDRSPAPSPDRPFSFEVLSDDFDEMEQQALQIATWGDNVYVKIPITDTRGRSSAALVKRLAQHGVKVNVTALMTLDQVDACVSSLRDGPRSCISIFAGRIADAGCDPLPILCGALARIRAYPQIELIWASPRELFNIVQADSHRLPHHHGHARSAEEASAALAAISPSIRSTR